MALWGVNITPLLAANVRQSHRFDLNEYLTLFSPYYARRVWMKRWERLV
jgi:hypothetical protein